MSSIASASAAPTAPVKAPPQAGILEGVNPVHFDKNHPIILFIVQVGCCLTLPVANRALWCNEPPHYVTFEHTTIIFWFWTRMCSTTSLMCSRESVVVQQHLANDSLGGYHHHILPSAQLAFVPAAPASCHF